MKFRCPHCTQKYDLSEDSLGVELNCQVCQGNMLFTKESPQVDSGFEQDKKDSFEDTKPRDIKKKKSLTSSISKTKVSQKTKSNKGSGKALLIALVLILGTGFYAYSKIPENKKSSKDQIASQDGLQKSSEFIEKQQALAVMPTVHKDIINKYCIDCHDSETQKGQVDLESLSYDLSSDIQMAERWQEVLDAVNSGDMPPKKKKQLTKEEKTDFLADLSDVMVVARKLHGDNGGVITMRRLNRREYANTVEGLLGVRPDVEGLPDDSAGGGFDTAGASLYFSSDQFEQYLEIAEGTLKKAFFDKEVKRAVKRLEAEDRYGRKHYEKLYKPIKEKGEKARQFFAAKKGTPFQDFGFKTLHQAYQAKNQNERFKPVIEDFLSRPATEHGTVLTSIITRNQAVLRMHPITAETEETIKVRVRAAAYPGYKERFYYLELRAQITGVKGVQTLGWRKVSASVDKPEIIEFTVPTVVGQRVQYSIAQRSHPPGSANDLGILYRQKIIHTPLAVWVDWVEVERSGRNAGDSPAVAEIFFQKSPEWTESYYAREVLSRFASKAFRTADPNKIYLDKLMKFYNANRTKGMNLRQALIQPLSIILASPEFLYMVESNGNQKLSDTELAVRLSYFLWSMPPDKELMDLAKQGKLTDPQVLKRQTSRLLADKRSSQFIEAFAYQWLGMDRLGMFVFDTHVYQEHDQAVLLGSRKEIYETMRYILDKQLPLKSLLKSDFIVVNDVMAEYYGLDKNRGHEYRHLKLPPESVRGGLLSTAAVLAMGSDGHRSSPVERGAWVLRHLLHNPPPPAPANVPQLDRFEDHFQPARKLGKAHQEEPQCVQCHRKIDPIGYGMENFDAAGLWREKEVVHHERKSKSFDIDPSGELPGGVKFNNFRGLKDAIAQKEDDFARGFAEALIAYGLGRPYGYSDYNFAESLLTKAKAKKYAISEFIHALVQSKRFQSK